MALLSVFLSYAGYLYFLYHASISIYLNNDKVKQYESFPNPIDIYSHLLMKWLCFIIYLFFEDFLVVLFEIIPLGSWFLLMFKLYMILPKSEVHLKFFRRVFGYFELQEEFINLSFYYSLISKHIILGSFKLNIRLAGALRIQDLAEIEKSLGGFLESISSIKQETLNSNPLIMDMDKKEEYRKSLIMEREEYFPPKLKKEDSFKIIKKSNLKEEVEEEKKENESNKESPVKKGGVEKKIKIVANSKENKEKLGEIGITKPKTKKIIKKEEKAEIIKEPKDTESQSKDSKDTKEVNDKDAKSKDLNEIDSSLKEKKKFTKAGVFETNVSVQTKEGSKLNPDLYEDFRALVILPEKIFILKNVDNEEEFLRKPLKEIKVISSVSHLIKVVYYLEDLDGNLGNVTTSHYSMKLKTKKEYDEWYIPISRELKELN